MEADPHCRRAAARAMACGHEILVANACKMALMWTGVKKSDREDARIRHRGDRVQQDLVLI